MGEKVYFGSKGGKYVIRFGKKVYLSSFGELTEPKKAPANKATSGRNKQVSRGPVNLERQFRECQRQLIQCQIASNALRTQLQQCLTDLDTEKRKNTGAGPSAGPSALALYDEYDDYEEPATYGGRTLEQIHQGNVAVERRNRGETYNADHIPWNSFGRRR